MVGPPWLPLPMALLEAQQEFWLSTLSKDTISAYQAKKMKWLDFAQLFRRSPQDLSPRNIIDYITYLATMGKNGTEPFAFSSLKAYVDFLGRATSFTSPGAPNPAQHPEVQLFLRGVARKLGKQVDKAEPCTLDHLRILNRAASNDPRNSNLQTVAVVATIAFWGCLRLGALIPKRPEKLATVLTLQDMQVRGQSLLITVRVSKTIQFGERQHRIEVPSQQDPELCPFQAFLRWTSVLQRPSSQTALCALSANNVEMLTYNQFLELLNGTIRPAANLTGHSFRRGFVRLAFIRGVPIWQVMHHGDWKTLEVAMSYAEDVLIPNPLGGISDFPQ